MIIFFGSRGYLRVLAMVNFVCNNCHNPVAQRVVQRITRFTVFFLPLFPISKSYTTTCTFCGFSQKISRELAEQYAGHAQQQYGPPQQSGQPEHYGSPQQLGQPQSPLAQQFGPPEQNGPR